MLTHDAVRGVSNLLWLKPCPQGLFFSFSTFFSWNVSRPFRLFLATSNCLWVSEDRWIHDSSSLNTNLCNIYSLYIQLHNIKAIMIKRKTWSTWLFLAEEAAKEKRRHNKGNLALKTQPGTSLFATCVVELRQFVHYRNLYVSNVNCAISIPKYYCTPLSIHSRGHTVRTYLNHNMASLYHWNLNHSYCHEERWPRQ